jgi:hypothetical protein
MSILAFEGDALLVECDQAAVGDGDAASLRGEQASSRVII